MPNSMTSPWRIIKTPCETQYVIHNRLAVCHFYLNSAVVIFRISKSQQFSLVSSVAYHLSLGITHQSHSYTSGTLMCHTTIFAFGDIYSPNKVQHRRCLFIVTLALFPSGVFHPNRYFHLDPGRINQVGSELGWLVSRERQRRVAPR